MFSFKGKTVLVTGGSRGIGAACVKIFTEAGADTAFNYNRKLRAAEALAEECADFDGGIFFDQCDVSDFRDVKSFFNKVLERFGKIDILVNNAGIWKYGAVDEMPADDWRETMQVNLDSIFFMTQLAVKHMKEKNIKGSIVNISSTAGQRGEAFHSHYAATKGAIISFTKSLAAELGPFGIRVNSVAPGWVDTDMSAEAIKEEGDKILSGIPIGFIPSAEDIAWPIVFIASDPARAVNGEIFNVNGGSVLCG